jgi:streptogramin lyase
LKAISASKLVSGLAVTATDVYVSFYAFESNEVADYARTGTTLAAPTRVKVAGLSATGDVAVDGSGDVIASDTGRDRVVEIMTSGTTVTLPFVGLTQPTAVAVDPSGDVFVIDTSPGTANPAFDGRVLELPWDGDGYGKQVTILDTGADGTGLQGLATDSSGHLFVGSYEGTANSVSVMEFTDTDDVYQQTETMPMSTGANIFALAIDPAGNLFVNTSSGTLANQYQTCPYTQCTIWEIQPYALAVDAADDVFAFDGTVSNNDVVVLTDSSTGWSSPVPVPFGTVQDPVSLAAEPSGTLFLGEAYVAGDAAIEQLPVTTS